jgi:predicted phage-related endonuclease
LKFAIQCQHQLAATGLEHAFIQGLIGRVPVIKHVPRNERFIDAMLGKLAEFWDYVERGELPPIDASAATGRILAKLWPEDSGATVVLPPESAEWDAALVKAKEDIKEAEARKLAAEN